MSLTKLVIIGIINIHLGCVWIKDLVGEKERELGKLQDPIVFGTP